MARKSTTDQQLDDLRAYVDESYLQNPANRAALAAQGAPLPPLAHTPGSDAANPFSGDEEGPATVDANGITAVGAVDTSGTTIPEEDELDALSRSTLELQDASAKRRAADRLKRDHPETDQAAQQATADQIQAAIGQARRASQLTQGGIRTRVFAAADRLGAVSTPGGIMALLLILWLLLFVLVPVNGQPRGVWLWLVLVRKARLMSEKKAAGLTGRSESAPTHTEASPGASEQVPTLSGLGVVAVNTQTPASQNVTPINFGSTLLNGASSDLNRYLKP